MDRLFDIQSLTIFYLVLLGLGVLYAVFVLIGGGLQDLLPGDVDLGGGDVEVDVGGGDFKLPALSPVTIASFVTAFGASGLVGISLFDASARASLVWAGLGGVLIAVLAHLAFGYFLIRPQGSSEVRLRDLAGTVGEVVTPIPATGLGEVAFVAQGGRLTYSARSATGEPVARGTTVVIEQIVGGVALVRPKT